MNLALKKFIVMAVVVLGSLGNAQTLEASLSYPFGIQAALYNLALSDVVSLDMAASSERLKLGANAVFDLAPIGNATASANLEFAYVGRVRVRLAAQATLGAANLALGVYFWNAAPANFDPFEIYAPDPLPNSASGTRVDLNAILRVSRTWALVGAYRFGSDISSTRLGLRLRQPGLEWYTGMYSAFGVGGSVYLLQSNLALPLGETISLSLGGGLGLLDSALAYEVQGQFAWELLENLKFSLGVNYQPWRFDVLPLRGSLEVQFAPGFGVLLLNVYAGRSQTSINSWGLRLTYRIAFEELFPS